MPGEESKTSVSDIAQMLLKPTAQPDMSAETDEDQSPDAGDLVTDLTTDDVAAEVEEAAEVDGQEQESEGTEEETEQADEEDEEASGYIDIRDDDVIEVMIDGKLETRTIGELKKAISFEGAIEKRLQEATETRKAAIAERTTALENLATQERIIASAFNAVEADLFKPVIPAPPAELKAKNPGAYLRHMEAYNEDQARIAHAKKAVQAKIEEFATQRNERLKEYAQVAGQQIVQLIPELADPKRATPMLGKLVETAKAYGYTDQEIGAALDPRMFHLVRDAMAYRELTSRSKEQKVVDLDAQRAKAPRRLRSGNTKATSLVAARSKQQSEAKATAQQTGKVADVAKTLLKVKVK